MRSLPGTVHLGKRTAHNDVQFVFHQLYHRRVARFLDEVISLIRSRQRCGGKPKVQSREAGTSGQNGAGRIVGVADEHQPGVGGNTAAPSRPGRAPGHRAAPDGRRRQTALRVGEQRLKCRVGSYDLSSPCQL